MDDSLWLFTAYYLQRDGAISSRGLLSAEVYSSTLAIKNNYAFFDF